MMANPIQVNFNSGINGSPKETPRKGKPNSSLPDDPYYLVVFSAQNAKRVSRTPGIILDK